MLHKHKSPIIHPILLPIEHSSENHREIKLNYELPYNTHISISLLDGNENVLEAIIDKDQNAGNYYIKQVLPESHSEFFLLFVSSDSRVLKRIKLNR